MEIIESSSKMKTLTNTLKSSGTKIGFVPTMGALHAGHLSLISRARKDSDVVVVSIFVNPTQFGENEDLDKYPRNLKSDTELCEKSGADYIFYPDTKDIYGVPSNKFVVSYPELSKKLCGKFRPGHFDGVTTIMTKLLAIVQPDKCFMGKKDGQQISIIKLLAKDIFSSCEVVGCSTVREQSGLAMSSRNTYLTPAQKSKATTLFSSLTEIGASLNNSSDELSIDQVLDLQHEKLAATPGIEVQYLDFVDRSTFDHVSQLQAGQFMICIAALLGTTRLIDNFFVDINQEGQISIDAGVQPNLEPVEVNR